MDDKLKERLIARFYPTATLVFLVTTAVVWGGMYLGVAPEPIEQALISAWTLYLGSFAGYMFGHEPKDEVAQGQGMSEAATHKLLDIVKGAIK